MRNLNLKNSCIEFLRAKINDAFQNHFDIAAENTRSIQVLAKELKSDILPCEDDPAGQENPAYPKLIKMGSHEALAAIQDFDWSRTY